MPSLDTLAVGQKGRIEKMAGPDGILQRLFEMGLFDGEEVEVVGHAPLGDPIEIALRDYRLSLRKSEAAGVIVSLIS